MGTKKHQKKHRKKPAKKTGRKHTFKGGDGPVPVPQEPVPQEPVRKIEARDDKNCVSFLGNTCTECKKGYVPVYGKNGKHCAPALGSTVDLQHILPNSITAHTADGDYTLEGSTKPGKKYDCTLCEKGYMPVGPIGERRCESRYAPIDKDDSRYCKDKIRDDCTVCKTMEDGTMMVPAGPLLHRRCIKTGQMWSGEFGPYDNKKLYTKKSFFERFLGEPADVPEAQPVQAQAQPYYRPEPEPAQPAIQPVIPPVVQAVIPPITVPVPPVTRQPVYIAPRQMTRKMRPPRPIIKYIPRPIVRYRNKPTRKIPKLKLKFKGRRQ